MSFQPPRIPYGASCLDPQLRVTEHGHGRGVTIVYPNGVERNLTSLNYAATVLNVPWDMLADHMERTNGVRPRYAYGGQASNE